MSVDVVTGFNAFQYAGEPVAALREAARVVKPGGRIAMVVWGRAGECEHAVTLRAIGACLPPPAGAGGPFALWEPGRVEALMVTAGLTPIDNGTVDCPFIYPNAETAWRAIRSAGPSCEPSNMSGKSAWSKQSSNHSRLFGRKTVGTGKKTGLGM